MLSLLLFQGHTHHHNRFNYTSYQIRLYL